MRVFAVISLIVTIFGVGPAAGNVANMVCYYDASSATREGPAQLTMIDLEPALQFCNYLIYGYAGIDDSSFRLKNLNPGQDYRTITTLKRKYPNLRILLSVGGDKDVSNEGELNKYLQLLEDVNHRLEFVRSASDVLQSNGFDGLDLAWQFPKNHPKVIQNTFKKAWSAVKGWFSGPKLVDEKAEEHKEQFTALVRELNSAFRNSGGFMLTLTLLPHVNAALFIDIFTVVANVDFVNLAAFDFQTPERDPKVADYPAPLYELYERDPEHNINYQVQYWINNTTPASKINVGIAAYGRAWRMTQDSGITGYPPIPETDGPAPAGYTTVTPGLLSWPEVCDKLPKGEVHDMLGAEAPLRKVGDPTRRYGPYAYHAVDEKSPMGVWVGFEDPVSAATKAGYVHAKGLGGVALFDLSMDDFKGRCAGEKYPILRSIKYKL